MPKENTNTVTSPPKPIDPDARLRLRPETLRVILAANKKLEQVADTKEPINHVSSTVEQMGHIYFGRKPISQKIAELKACLEVATLYVNKLKTEQRARIKLL